MSPPLPTPAARHAMTTDPHASAFVAPDTPEVFHPVAHRHEIWRPDPFDVEAIHADARAAFRRLVHAATTPPGLPSGRILLLLGEAGSGKTHLMRAFRNWAHGRGLAYCGYMQMTSAANDYGRYLLGNLIDSLDVPYDQARGPATGLRRLSTALAEAAPNSAELLASLRDDDLTPADQDALVTELADRVVYGDARFDAVDLDLVRALLFLQRDDARVRGRVVKYLRCEGLTPADRRLIGGLEPRTYGDAPQRLAEKLGVLMGAVDSSSLVLCVDQLEDIYNMEEAPRRFRRAMAAVCELVDRVPSSVVVVACLEDFYMQMRSDLTRPVVDRLEHDPAPVRLVSNRDAGEVRELVARRLDALYAARDLAPRPGAPTYPFPDPFLDALAGQRTRDVVAACHAFRERSVRLGAVDADAPAPPVAPTPEVASTKVVLTIEQRWNDFHHSLIPEVPADDADQLALLAWAVERCSDELPTGHRFAAEVHTNPGTVPTADVICQAPDGSVARLVLGVCNKSARGGGLSRQIAAVKARGSREAPVVTPVVVRSSGFPSNPKAQIATELGQFITDGGRRAVIEDNDWRTMLALRAFHAEIPPGPEFDAWLRHECPLSQRPSLRTVLDLDHLAAPALAPARPRNTPPPVESPSPEPPPAEAPSGTGPLVIGTTHDRASAPVTLEPDDFLRHAAFLGSSGSGKTTLALTVVEQLLLRGVPAILVDRKGDLCGYAPASSSASASSSPFASASPPPSLPPHVDVSVYTPGDPNGRPLSIAVAPEGLGELPTFERETAARYAAAALGGMMNYGHRASDRARLAVLAKAIEMLAQVEPGRPVGLESLTAYVHEKDPALVNAVGLLDTRNFEKLVQDLETLRIHSGRLLAAEGERLDVEALFGLGRHARPGRTRLTVVSTRSLGGTADVQFWVSQFLTEVLRWAGKSPSPTLQAVILFDEADLYLPAVKQPPTKEPLEDLLRRARSAGLGLLLATQSPGDLDYQCRDQIRSWFVGQVREATAVAKMKPMLSECRVDVAAKLPGQRTGEFHLLRDGQAVPFRAARNAVPPVQLPEDQILALARSTRPVL